MKKVIFQFENHNRFLSNFWESEINLYAQTFPTVEHFYQSQKAANEKDFLKIANAASPGLAKRLGGKVKLVKDWEDKKDAVMKIGVEAKFTQNPELAKQLIETEGWELWEGNFWGDTYWGVDLKTGQGKNKLGKILMTTRQLLIDNKL